MHVRVGADFVTVADEGLARPGILACQPYADADIGYAGRVSAHHPLSGVLINPFLGDESVSVAPVVSDAVLVPLVGLVTPEQPTISAGMLRRAPPVRSTYITLVL
ncbi:hypothetical protein AB0B60_42915 [Streptomyces lincolnensis]|uniref:hypothetical protein n=1 Tax=Streptomyces lincolnensis TaxID=1915 RepID=UPI0013520DAC|nr:hypothetical protein [Streptomyces lincolnensis]